MRKKIHKYDFPKFKNIDGKMNFSEFWKIELSDFYAHLADLSVQKYQPSFPYWLYIKETKYIRLGCSTRGVMIFLCR